MVLDRRRFLALSASMGFAGLFACETSEPAAESQPARPAFEFVPYVVGANTAISGYGFFEAVELLADIGYRTIEIQSLIGTLEPTLGEFPGFRCDQVSAEEKVRILESLKPFDHVTVHLPYEEWIPYIDPDSEEGVAFIETCLDATGFLGAKLAVLHPQPRRADLYANWATAVERIRKWGSMAADRGFRLACETAMPNSLPDLMRFIEEIGHDNVGVTLDVGHQARFKELADIPKEAYAKPESVQAYNDLNIRIAEALGEKLFHVHTHDIEPETWAEHKPLIHGFIDYPRLIAKLRELEYSGVLVFEMGGDPEKMPEWLRKGKRKMDGYVEA